MYEMSEVRFVCRLTLGHEGVHLADHDFPHIRKRITLSWGDGTGKPRTLPATVSIATFPVKVEGETILIELEDR